MISLFHDRPCIFARAGYDGKVSQALTNTDEARRADGLDG